VPRTELNYDEEADYEHGRPPVMQPDELEKLRVQMEGISAQIDFLQTLWITGMEQQQELLTLLKQRAQQEAPRAPSDVDVRAMRLNFFK